jgi:hypothetical protein
LIINDSYIINIKVLTVLLKCFPKKLNDIINEILTQVWNCLVQSSETYVTKVINADSNQASSNQANNSTDIDFEGIYFVTVTISLDCFNYLIYYCYISQMRRRVLRT